MTRTRLTLGAAVAAAALLAAPAAWAGTADGGDALRDVRPVPRDGARLVVQPAAVAVLDLPADAGDVGAVVRDGCGATVDVGPVGRDGTAAQVALPGTTGGAGTWQVTWTGDGGELATSAFDVVQGAACPAADRASAGEATHHAAPPDAFEQDTGLVPPWLGRDLSVAFVVVAAVLALARLVGHSSARDRLVAAGTAGAALVLLLATGSQTLLSATVAAAYAATALAVAAADLPGAAGRAPVWRRAARTPLVGAVVLGGWWVARAVLADEWVVDGFAHLPRQLLVLASLVLVVAVSDAGGRATATAP